MVGKMNSFIIFLVMQFFLAISIYFFAIILHELGHWFFLNRYNQSELKVKFWYSRFTIMCGRAENYEGLAYNDHRTVLLAGIFAGLAPIAIAFIFAPYPAFLALS